MRIPNRAGILVTDGRKMLLFRNEGDADYPNFQNVMKEQDDNPADRLHRSDAAGQTVFAGAAGRGSGYDEGDLHRQEEARFAVATMQVVNRSAEAGAFDKLVIVADPHTLGALRPHYGRAIQDSLIGEIAKDLVNHPVVEIERILSAR